MHDIKTEDYHLLTGSGAGRGTFIIVRVWDDATTLRFTGSGAVEAFLRFKEARRISKQAFNDFCKAENFEKDF